MEPTKPDLIAYETETGKVYILDYKTFHEKASKRCTIIRSILYYKPEWTVSSTGS